MPRATIDVLSEDPGGGTFTATLVEEGPWPDHMLEPALRNLQDWLFTTVDAIVEGAIAERYPETRGKPFTVFVNCFDVPEEQVRELFFRFRQYIDGSAEYQSAISNSAHVSSFDFQIRFGTLRDRHS